MMCASTLLFMQLINDIMWLYIRFAVMPARLPDHLSESIATTMLIAARNHQLNLPYKLIFT